MARTLSQDLRDRVIAAIDAGLSCRAAADRFGVSASSAIRWRQRALELLPSHVAETGIRTGLRRMAASSVNCLPNRATLPLSKFRLD